MAGAISSLGISSGQIALQILRGASGNRGPVQPVSALKALQSPTVSTRADAAIAQIMRIVIDAQGGTTISGANQQSSVGFASGWKVGVQAEKATGQGAASIGDATAVGAGEVSVSSVRISGSLEGQAQSRHTLTSATGQGAVMLETGSASVAGAAAGKVDLHVERHQMNASGSPAAGFVDIYGQARGDMAMSVNVAPTDGFLTRVNAGEGNDSIAITAGLVGGVYAGAGNDAITVTSLSARRDAVDNVNGGDGDDAIAISSQGGVTRTYGGDGNDAIAIRAAGDVSNIYGDDGDDAVAVMARDVSGIYGGDGNDAIAIVADHVSGVSGGDGNDTIYVRASSIDGVSGGRGDDRITIDNAGGGLATVMFAEGDGDDTIESNGPLSIRRVSGDGTRDLGSAAFSVARNDDGTTTLRFEGSNDSITLRFTGAMAGRDPSISVDRFGLIVR